MLERLIELTNSEAYIQNGHLTIREVVARQREFDLKVTFDIQNAALETKQYECEIYCENVIDFHRVQEYKRPYNRINLHNDHPLLWNYKNTPYLRLKGQNANIAELMGDLFLVHDKICGNWVDFHWLFHSLTKRLTSDKGATIAVPQQLVSAYLPVFDKHQLNYSLNEPSEAVNNYLVLLFGNPDISPDSYNFGQPYIVAEKFTEHVAAANTQLDCHTGLLLYINYTNTTLVKKMGFAIVTRTSCTDSKPLKRQRQCSTTIYSAMDTKSNNIIIEGLSEETTLVSLKWLRGANRYNNGATRYGRKYHLRLIMGWAGQRKLKCKVRLEQ